MVHAQTECNKAALGNAWKYKNSSVNEQESSIRRNQVTVTH